MPDGKLVNNTLSMGPERGKADNGKCYQVQTFISMLVLDE